MTTPFISDIDGDTVCLFFDVDDLHAGHIEWSKSRNKCYLFRYNDEGKLYNQVSCLGECHSIENLEAYYNLRAFL